MRQIRCIALLVVWPAIACAQTTDLRPLLPPPNARDSEIRAALESGQIKRAIVMAAALEGSAGYLWQGILAITQDESARAVRALRKADDPKALGVAYYLAGQYVLFRQQMDEAIRRNPEDFGPYYYLGRHFDSDQDNAAEALRWLQLAEEKNPDYTPARAYRGNCLERLGRTTEAEAAYKASLNEFESQLGLARLRLAAGDSSSALALVQKAIALNPRDARGPKLEASIYRTLNRRGEIIRALQAAALLAPRDASIHYQLARAWQATGETDRSAAAMREFERLRAIYGVNP